LVGSRARGDNRPDSDIAHHIDLAVRLRPGSTMRHSVADPGRVYAVTRCLEIISEASRRLPDNVKARHPSIAWKDMAGAGNIYRVAAAHQADPQMSCWTLWHHGDTWCQPEVNDFIQKLDRVMSRDRPGNR
jgi:uncharacterized protein with HEPN domain